MYASFPITQVGTVDTVVKRGLSQLQRTATQLQPAVHVELNKAISTTSAAMKGLTKGLTKHGCEFVELFANNGLGVKAEAAQTLLTSKLEGLEEGINNGIDEGAEWFQSFGENQFAFLIGQSKGEEL